MYSVVDTSQNYHSITHSASVVVELKVSLILGSLVWLGLAKGWRLAQMVLIQLGQEGLVTGLGKHALFFKDGQDAHGLLKYRVL